MTLEPLALFDFFIFKDVAGFLIFVILCGGIAGLIARSVAVGAFGALLIFIHVAMETDVWIFTELLYGVLVVTFLIMGIQVVSYILEQRRSAM